MDGFYLLCGHLLGDYILQNDWLARGKTSPVIAQTEGLDFWQVLRLRERGVFICHLHCALYTFAVWAFSWWWLPPMGLLACFTAHYVVDRSRLAYHWMTKVSGQYDFATGALAPWSIIVVDNTFHLLTLAVIALVSGR